MKKTLVLLKEEIRKLSEKENIYIISIQNIWKPTEKYILKKNEFNNLIEVISKNINNRTIWINIKKYYHRKEELSMIITKCWKEKILLNINKKNNLIYSKENVINILNFKNKDYLKKYINETINYIKR